MKDPALDQQIKMLIEDIDNNFVSEYELAAQNVLTYVQQSRTTNLADQKRLLLLDLLIAGRALFRVKPSPEGTNIVIEVLNPLNTFVDRNPNSPYAKDGYRAVVRKWMTREEILAEYGDELTKDALDELDSMINHYENGNFMYVSGYAGQFLHAPMEGDLDNGKRVVPGFPIDGYETYMYKLLPVYEVEWIDVDKVKGQYIENRYEGIRIGQSIYIPRGLSKNVIRTHDAARHCKLSIGGIFLTNRDNLPTSLVLQCCLLQDKYDVVIFLRDNILANSGTIGDWVDVSMLPTFLGTDMTERLQKWSAYKKSGIALIDSSQEGRGFNNNTFMSGFDDAAKVQIIQAFEIVLDRIENQVTSITGVFRERLNGITQRDAVSNIEAGAKNSFTITKPFYQQMDILVTDLLIDCIDMAKIVWKDGLTGSIVLGDHLQKVFTVLPENFTFTDYDVHIVASTQILKELEQLRAYSTEMIKAGMLEPDMISDTIACKSLTELKHIIKKGWAKKKQENDIISKLQDQLQQAEQQMQQLQQQNQQLSQKLEQLNEAKMQLEKQKIDNDREIRWYQAQTDRTYREQQIEVDKDKVKIELSQINDGNPYNDQVRFT